MRNAQRIVHWSAIAGCLGSGGLYCGVVFYSPVLAVAGAVIGVAGVGTALWANNQAEDMGKKYSVYVAYKGEPTTWVEVGVDLERKRAKQIAHEYVGKSGVAAVRRAKTVSHWVDDWEPLSVGD